MAIPLTAFIQGDTPPPSGDLANTVVTGTLSSVGPGIAHEFRGPFNVAIWGSVNTTLTTTANSSSATLGSGTGITAGSSINSANVPPGTTVKTISGTSITLAFPIIAVECAYQAGFNQITNLGITSGLVGATVVSSDFPSGTTILSIAQAAGVTPTGQTVPGIAVTSAAPINSSTPPGFPIGGAGQNRILFQLSASGVVSGADAGALFTGSGVTYSATVELDQTFDGGKTWTPCNVGGGGQLASYSAGTPLSFIAGEVEYGVGYRVNCTAYTSGTINYRLSTSGQAALSLSLTSTV